MGVRSLCSRNLYVLYARNGASSLRVFFFFKLGSCSKIRGSNDPSPGCCVACKRTMAPALSLGACAFAVVDIAASGALPGTNFGSATAVLPAIASESTHDVTKTEAKPSEERTVRARDARCVLPLGLWMIIRVIPFTTLTLAARRTAE